MKYSKKICGIYKITSPSAGIYIGQSENIFKRFGEYKRLECERQRALYNSFIKYGVEAHLFEIQEKCDIDKLTQREIYWSDFYDSVNNGLNCIKPGSWLDRETTKAKMSENGKRQKVNLIGLQKSWKNNIGKTGSLCHNAKAVFQYDMCGIFLREWGSIVEAAKYLNTSHSKISSVCIGDRHSAAGFLWRYAALNYEGQMISTPMFKKHKHQYVAEIDNDNKILKLYKNVKEASIALDMQEQNLRNYCRSGDIIKKLNKRLSYPSAMSIYSYKSKVLELIP